MIVSATISPPGGWLLRRPPNVEKSMFDQSMSQRPCSSPSPPGRGQTWDLYALRTTPDPKYAQLYSGTFVVNGIVTKDFVLAKQ